MLRYIEKVFLRRIDIHFSSYGLNCGLKNVSTVCILLHIL